MLKFSNDFEGTGAYKGVQLNRGRVATRQKRQARLEEFGVCAQAEEEDTTVAAVLFGPFNFYCQSVTNALNERFSIFKEAPLCFFMIFDYTA